MDLSIIIPCYNEEETIQETCSIINQYMSEDFCHLNYELILINDGSTDKTSEIINQLQSNIIKPLHFLTNKGRGEAIKYGISCARGRILITLDADLSYDVNHIGAILSCFNDDPKTDVVIVSAYKKGGSTKNVPFSRLLLSRIANWILSGFFQRRFATVTCVVRGYKAEMIKKICLIESGKELHLEILRKLDLYNAQIKEIPGQLVWKKDPQKKKRRKNNLKIFDSGTNHLMYGLIIKPTGFFKLLTVLFLAIGLYEAFVVGWSALNHLDINEQSFARSLWKGLNYAFLSSPHSFFIGLGALILGLNTFCFLILLAISKKHHEENLRHILTVLERSQGR